MKIDLYTIEETKTAKKDKLKILKSGTTSLKNKVKGLVEDIQLHPDSGLGSPEPLKHELKTYWSRELSKKDRIVYSFDEQTKIVTIYQYLGHYKDK